MRSLYDIIQNRRSIRKYTDDSILAKDIEEIIQAAVKAPSACNEQMWKFIVVKNRAIIEEIAGAISNKLDEMKEWKEAEDIWDRLESKKKAINFFAKAPVVVAVYMTDYKYYDPEFLEAFRKKFSKEELDIMFGNADVQSIGAAIQNLLLAVEEKGYGACWMCDPLIAFREIGKILGEEGSRLMAIIPIGVPAKIPAERPKKKLEEVYRVIE